MYAAGNYPAVQHYHQQAYVAAQLPPSLQLQGAPTCRNPKQLLTECQLAASFSIPQQLHFLHAHVASSSRRQLVVASAAKPQAVQGYSDEEDQGLLGWAYEEQQQQQQQQLPLAGKPVSDQQKQEDAASAAHSQQRPRQVTLRKHTAKPGTDAATAAKAQRTTNTQRRKQTTHGANARQQQQQQQRGQQQTLADADGYAAAQERVRQLLITADINDLEAAAAALPDNVNDIVIALQLLATAPKPPGLAAAKRYDAAVQQLAAAVVRKFKQLLLKGQLQDEQRQQQQQHDEVAGHHHPSQASSSSSSSSSVSSMGLVQQPAESRSHPAAAAAAAQDMHASLASALAGLPGTKLAAAAFSLGVLRHYDAQLVPALEQGSLQVMLSINRNGSSSSSSAATYKASEVKAGLRRQQQQQPRPVRINANQLGQLAQGFVYLDHELSPAWQAAFLQVCRKQMQHMKAPQLASIAAFLLRYRLCSNSSSSSSSSGSSGADTDRLLAHLSSTSRLLSSSSSSGIGMGNSSSAATAVAAFNKSSSSLTAAAAVTAAGGGASCVVAYHHPAAAAAAAGLSSGDITWQLYSGWSEAFVTTAAQQAQTLKPHHLVPVLQAAAGLYQQHLQLQGAKRMKMLPQQQQQQQQQSALAVDDAASVSSNKQRRQLAAARAFGDLPCAMPATHHAAAARKSAGYLTSSSSSGSSWLQPLLLSFQQQLPDMKMQHLAAVLPALAQLTVLPWPGKAAELVLLQLRLLLPSSTGSDAVAAAAAAACLAPPGAIAADSKLSDALLQRLHAVMPTLGPGELAAAVQTLAVLQVKPYRAWIYELCARLRVEACNMSALEVLAALEGLAALRVQVDPEVMHLFVLGVQRGLGVMSSSELQRTVAALRRMYPRVLPGRTVARLVEEMQRRVALLELQEIGGF
jgi:hypothetical protein